MIMNFINTLALKTLRLQLCFLSTLIYKIRVTPQALWLDLRRDDTPLY